LYSSSSFDLLLLSGFVTDYMRVLLDTDTIWGGHHFRGDPPGRYRKENIRVLLDLL
jgi:hypothetical protein